MANTTHRGYPLPVDIKTVRQEIENLQQNVLPMLDNDVQNLFDAIADLAPIAHTHDIADVTGLTEALASKMAANTTFALSNLTDVVGSAEAPDGYILAKVGDEYVAQAALAALGEHGHTISQVSGLNTALTGLGNDIAARLEIANFSTKLTTDIHAATAKATPVDADELGIWDSVSAGLRRLSLANLKAGLLAYFITKFVRIDADQAFSNAEQAQARKNIGIEIGHPLLHVVDERASGVSGGSAQSFNSVNTRVLNTIRKNNIPGASLSTNQVTLPAGTYFAIARAPAYQVGRHQAYITNTTTSSDLGFGSSEYTSSTQTASVVEVMFTLSATAVLELRHVTNATVATDGLGVSKGYAGYPEIYSDMKIWKLK